MKKENLTRRDLEENAGRFWHELHAEREQICENLVQNLSESKAKGVALSQVSERESLQRRLRVIDGILDQLLEQTPDYSELAKLVMGH